MSNIVNKVKDALHSDKHSSSSGTTEGTAGPHNSRMANAADPRVDSDMDGSRNAGMRKAGHGEYGSSGVGNTFSSSGMSEGATGPHSSRLANAADPRVDSDRDGSRTAGGMGGMTGTTGTTGGFSGLGHTGNTGNSGFGSTGNTFGGTGAGAGSGRTGMTGTHGAPAGTHGPHSSRLANAADPRVDSDRDGRGAVGTGPGPASNTAGPHSSDLANKMDPRVDSDLDGSKTMGGNKTYQ